MNEKQKVINALGKHFGMSRDERRAQMFGVARKRNAPLTTRARNRIDRQRRRLARAGNYARA